jgi:hypothetical protein
MAARWAHCEPAPTLPSTGAGSRPRGFPRRGLRSSGRAYVGWTRKMILSIAGPSSPAAAYQSETPRAACSSPSRSARRPIWRRSQYGAPEGRQRCIYKAERCNWNDERQQCNAWRATRFRDHECRSVLLRRGTDQDKYFRMWSYCNTEDRLRSIEEMGHAGPTSAVGRALEDERGQLRSAAVASRVQR